MKTASHVYSWDAVLQFIVQPEQLPQQLLPLRFCFMILLTASITERIIAPESSISEIFIVMLLSFFL